MLKTLQTYYRVPLKWFNKSVESIDGHSCRNADMIALGKSIFDLNLNVYFKINVFVFTSFSLTLSPEIIISHQAINELSPLRNTTFCLGGSFHCQSDCHRTSDSRRSPLNNFCRIRRQCTTIQRSVLKTIKNVYISDIFILKNILITVKDGLNRLLLLLLAANCRAAKGSPPVSSINSSHSSSSIGISPEPT